MNTFKALLIILFLISASFVGWLYLGSKAPDRQFYNAVADFNSAFSDFMQKLPDDVREDIRLFDFSYPADYVSPTSINLYAKSPKAVEARQRLLKLTGAQELLFFPTISVEGSNTERPELLMVVPDVPSFACKEKPRSFGIVSIRTKEGYLYTNAKAIRDVETLNIGRHTRGCFETNSGLNYFIILYSL